MVMQRAGQPTGDVWSELALWGREKELNELDALMWRTERHPEGSWSGIIVHLLDEVPDWERLRAAHEWFLRLVPRFRERVVDPVLPVGTPMWVADPAFDLDYHGGFCTRLDALCHGSACRSRAPLASCSTWARRSRSSRSIAPVRPGWEPWSRAWKADAPPT